MNPSTPTTIDVHNQTLLLLPWYVNQSLQPKEREQVEGHIRYCLLCRRELVSLRKLAETVTAQSNLEIAAESSFASLRSKLPVRASDKTLVTPAAKTTKLTKLVKFSRQNAARFAIAASLLVATTPFTLYTTTPRIPDNYYTLSSAKTELANGKHLRIVFAKQLSSTEITAILTAIHGQRIDQPNSVGAFTVKLDDIDSPKLEDVIALLRNRPDVLLAEPVVQP